MQPPWEPKTARAGMTGAVRLHGRGGMGTEYERGRWEGCSHLGERSGSMREKAPCRTQPVTVQAATGRVAHRTGCGATRGSVHEAAPVEGGHLHLHSGQPGRIYHQDPWSG